MFRVDRVVLIVSLLSFGAALSACADFDPDKLDIFGVNKEKKLPGERRALFPEGVPGVTQGVPPELVKGHQQSFEAQQAEMPVVEEKPKPKPRVVRRPPPKAPAPAQPARAAPPSPPKQQQAAPWPETPAAPQQSQQAPQQAPWPAPTPQQQRAPTPWPDPPPAGTFTR
jgi:hypothetical protein